MKILYEKYSRKISYMKNYIILYRMLTIKNVLKI